eukprot:7383326-Prymnesium_polylepis.2
MACAGRSSRRLCGQRPLPMAEPGTIPLTVLWSATGLCIFLNLDVERISEDEERSRIQQYRFHTAELEAQAQRARAGWAAGCAAPPPGSCEVFAVSQPYDNLGENFGWDFFIKLDCLQRTLSQEHSGGNIRVRGVRQSRDGAVIWEGTIELWWQPATQQGYSDCGWGRHFPEEVHDPQARKYPPAGTKSTATTTPAT